MDAFIFDNPSVSAKKIKPADNKIIYIRDNKNQNELWFRLKDNINGIPAFIQKKDINIQNCYTIYF